MITVITGLTGSGKTWLMAKLCLKKRKQGDIIYPNLAFNFPNNNEGVIRWHNLDETFNLYHGTIAIDEGQKLFNSHQWMFLPQGFADKISSHRHQDLDVITTTQDFGFIDIVVRQNVHELYQCKKIFRFPKNDRVKPIIQITKVIKKERSWDDTTIKWTKTATRYYLISKFNKKELYNTFANIDLSHFLCQVKRDKKKWLITLTSRAIVNRRKG